MPRPKLNRKCSEIKCERPHHARGFCMLHYSKTDFKKTSNKNYRLRNPQKVREWRREQDRRYRARYPEKMRSRAASRRATKVEGLKRFGWIDYRLIDNYYTRLCGICGLLIESSFEVDHIIPLSRNGSHTLGNLQITHPVCNRVKHGRLQKEMELDTMILKELIND